MMFVHADRIEADTRGEFQFVHEVVVHEMRTFGIEQGGVDIDPHGRVRFAKVRRQFRAWHQVKPHQLLSGPLQTY
jgi:hypothetical protein